MCTGHWTSAREVYKPVILCFLKSESFKYMTCQVIGERMRILIDDFNQFYGEKVRFIKTLMKRESPEEFPELLKWKLQTLYLHQDQWIEMCRIDNYPHENQPGSHIHQYGKKEVLRIPLSFEEAKERIEQITRRVLQEKFNEIVTFE